MRKINPEKIKDEMIEGPSREIYPHFGIEINHIPEAKDYPLGKKYKITLEAKLTGKSINERMGKKGGYADFDIYGIEAAPAEKKYKLLYRSET